MPGARDDEKENKGAAKAAAPAKETAKAVEKEKVGDDDGDGTAIAKSVDENIEKAAGTDKEPIPVVIVPAADEHKGEPAVHKLEKETEKLNTKDAEAAVVDEDKAKNLSVVDEVEVVAKKAKLYKVRFLKDHEFNIGIEKFHAKKGDAMEVELHVANTLAERNIAHHLG